MTEGLRTELLIAWLAAASALALGLHILRTRERTLLEDRSIVLLIALGVLMLAQGIHWLRPQSAGPRALTVVAAAFAPLALCLFAEGLLRRHLPFWLKLTSTAAAAAGLPLAAVPRLAAPVVLYAAAPALLAVSACACVVAARRHDGLTRAERELAKVCVAAAALAVPLGATDLGWGPARLGGLGVLGFVYAFARVTLARNRPSRVLWDASWRLAQAVTLAGVLLLFAGAGGPLRRLHAFAAALAVVLALEVWERLSSRVVLKEDRSFMRWLTEARVTSRRSFVRSLRRYPLTQQHVLLRGDELAGYAPEALLRAFADSESVCSAAALRRARDTASGDRLDAAEQMLDLLGTHQMTHACLLSERPPELLLVHLPDTPGTHDAELELRVIQRYGSLVAAMEVTHA